MCRLYNTYIFVFGSLEVTKGYYILRRKGKVSKMSARKSQNNNICIYHLREAAKKVIFLIFKAPPPPLSLMLVETLIGILTNRK